MSCHSGERKSMAFRSNSDMSRRQVLARAAGGAAVLAATNLGSAAQPRQDSASADEPAIRNNHIKQTICRWCYAKIPLDELCQHAVRLGFKGIDLVRPPEFATIKKYGLVGSMTSTHPIPKGLNRKENWDDWLGQSRAAIDATSAAGFPGVICFSGNRAGMDLDEGMKNCAQAVKQVVGQA